MIHKTLQELGLSFLSVCPLHTTCRISPKQGEDIICISGLPRMSFMFVLHYISPRMNIAYKEKNQTGLTFWWPGGFRMVELSHEKASEAMVLIW